jgi:hypothetical protein
VDNIDEVTDKHMEALEEIEKRQDTSCQSIQQKGKSQIFSGR